MSRFTNYDGSAILSLVAGIVFMLVAAVQLSSDGAGPLTVVNGGLGLLLLLDGGRRLWLADRSAE